MKKKSTRVVALAIAIAMPFTLSGCGLGSGGSQPNVTQRVDYTGQLSGEITFQTWSLKTSFSDYFTALIRSFEQQHPGVTINWIDQPASAYADKVTSQITSQSLPDVANLPPDIAHAAVTAGALLNLSHSLPSLSEDYVTGAVDAYRYDDMDGGVYGLPWYLGTTVSYWNTDILAQAGIDTTALPSDLDGLITAATALRNASEGTSYLMTRLPGLGDLVDVAVPLMDDSGSTFTFNQPAGAQMLQKYIDAYQNGLMPPDVLSNGYGGDSTLFVKGQGGWTAGPGSLIANLHTENPSLTKKVVSSANIGIPPLFVQGLSVAATSENPSLALAFALYVTNAENQTRFTTETTAKGFYPGVTAARDNPVFTQSDGTNAGDASVLAYRTLAEARNLVPAVWTDAMGKYFTQQVTAAMKGDQTAQRALDKSVAYANKLLQE